MQQSIAFLCPGSVIRWCVSDTSRVLFPKRILKCSRRAARVLNSNRSMNRRHQLTIQPRASNHSDLIDLVDLSACPPTLKDRVRLAPFVSLLSLSFSFAFVRIIPFLLYHRLALLICPSSFLRSFKTRRCNATKRIGTNSISRQKHRTWHCQWHSNGVSNIVKMIRGTIQ